MAPAACAGQTIGKSCTGDMPSNMTVSWTKSENGGAPVSFTNNHLTYFANPTVPTTYKRTVTISGIVFTSSCIVSPNSDPWVISSSATFTPCYSSGNNLTTLSVTNSTAPNDNNWIWSKDGVVLTSQTTKTLVVNSTNISTTGYLYGSYTVSRAFGCSSTIGLYPPSNTVIKYVCRNGKLNLEDLPCPGVVNNAGIYLGIIGNIVQWTCDNTGVTPPPNGWKATIHPSENAIYKRSVYAFGSGNAFYSTTFDVRTVDSQIQLTGTAICPGGSTILTINNLTPVLPIKNIISWKFNGQVLDFLIGGEVGGEMGARNSAPKELPDASIMAIPSSLTVTEPGTYTVTVEVEGGCTVSATFVVVVQYITGILRAKNNTTGQLYQDNESITICPDNTLSLDLLSNYQLVNFNWYMDGATQANPNLSFSGNTADISFSSFGNENSYTTGQIVAKVVSTLGCTTEITRKIVILGQCCVPKALVLGSPDEESTAYYGQLPDSPNNQYLVAGNLELYGDDNNLFDISNKEIFVNSQYKYWDEPEVGGYVYNYRMTFLPGGHGENYATIQNSSIKAACNAMWDGIYLQKGAVLNVMQSSIADSYNGITPESGSLYVDNCEFNNNFISINSVQNGDIMTVSNSNFQSDPHLMKAPFDLEHNTQIIGSDNGIFYAHPFIRTNRNIKNCMNNTFNGAMYGIEFLDAYGDLVLGWGDGKMSGFNKFRNIFVAGIYDKDGENTLQPDLCEFYYADINLHTKQSEQTRDERGIDLVSNYGIYIAGTSNNLSILNNNLFQSPNDAHYGLAHVGIFTQNVPNVAIAGKNKFSNLRTGVQLTGNGDNYSIRGNGFSECQTSIHINKQETSPLILGFTCNQFAKKWEGTHTAVLLEGNAPIRSSTNLLYGHLGDCSFSNNIIDGNSPQGNEISFGIDLPAATPNDMVFIRNLMTNKITYYRFNNENTGNIPSINAEAKTCYPIVINANDNTCMNRNGVLERVAAPSRPTTLQNSPNPATSNTLMSYELSENLTPETLAQNPVRLQIRDVTGKLWYEQSLSESNGSLEFNTAHWPSGIYLGSLLHNGKVLAKHKIAIQQ